MQETLNDIQTYGYIVLFVYSMGGGFVGIVAAGVLSALGKLDLSLSILIACLGNIAGSMLLAYLSRYQKQDFQKYLHKHKRKIALVYLYLRRYGILLIFINKFIYGFKTILPLAIGLSRYSFKKFFFFNALACLLWAVSIGLCSYWASDMAVAVFEKIQSYPYIMPLFLFTLVGGILLTLWIKSKKKS
ncbi:DedA family protein [Helicobacter brantae]|uniref:DedA family protein n=1 Tax=Helicobacter brantae TaxID=375927 RepID=A0A3D8J3J7_9HELI|nr:DedA family protein [Helicobacter brantae]RDU71725.1 DedA family protein [Helicobacter brantae]